MPNSVKIIIQIAFLACDRLKTITLPSELTKIGGSAFEMCNKLAKIDIPDSTTMLEHSAFGFCENLESVIDIMYDAFLQCSNLVLKVKENSYAHEFANKNDIAYAVSS